MRHTSNEPRYFDPRTTAEVEEKRSTHNQKPFRTAQQKIEAQHRAVRQSGTFVSNAPVSYHPKPAHKF